MVLCPGCGAGMAYDPGSGKLSCGYCKSTYTIDEYHRLKDGGEEKTLTADSYEVSEFSCPQCGSRLLSTDETAVTFCSYCGANVCIESRLSREKKPAVMIPFRITREQCQKEYRTLLRRSLFAPSYLSEDAQVEKFRGIYMPYWCYEFKNTAPALLSGAKKHLEDEDEVTEHYEIRFPAEALCENVTYDAQSLFHDNLSNSIAPYLTEESVPFDPLYLSGFYADTEDVDSEAYLDRAHDIAATEAAIKIKKSFPSREYGLTGVAIKDSLSLSHTGKLGLFPVWFLAVRSKKGDRISYAAVNGQTGKIAADLPVDPAKYIAASVLLAVPVFLLLNLFVTVTPGRLMVLTAFLSFTSLMISFMQIDRLYTEENHFDDDGLRYVMKPRKDAGTLRRKLDAVSSLRLYGISLGCILLALLIFGLGIVLGLILTTFTAEAGPLLLIWLIGFPLYSVRFIKELYIDRELFYMPDAVLMASVPLKEKLLRCKKQLLALVLPVAVRLVNPVSDLWFYLAAVLSLLLITVSCLDIIQKYNRLTERELPVLAPRGGDENA